MKKNIEIALWVALAAAAGFAIWTYFPRPDMKTNTHANASAKDITPSVGSHDMPMPDMTAYMPTIKKVVEV